MEKIILITVTFIVFIACAFIIIKPFNSHSLKEAFPSPQSVIKSVQQKEHSRKKNIEEEKKKTTIKTTKTENSSRRTSRKL